VRLPGTAREGSQGSVMGEGRGGECGKEGMFVGRETGVSCLDAPSLQVAE